MIPYHILYIINRVGKLSEQIKLTVNYEWIIFDIMRFKLYAFHKKNYELK
jgi:hypothetical protein